MTPARDSFELVLTPAGHLLVREGDAAGPTRGRRASPRPSAPTRPPAFWRDFAALYLARLCRTPEGEAAAAPLEPPPSRELTSLVAGAPPMPGAEYLDAGVLAALWRELDAWVRGQLAGTSLSAWLRRHAPGWHQVGRVCFHLAENKRDEDYPFAFLATYAPRLSKAGRVQYQPLRRALQEYAGARDKPALVRLLSPVQTASEHREWVRRLVDLALGGERLTRAEWRRLASAGDGLVRLKGRWVEVDGERLSEALAQWERVKAAAARGGLSFTEGMRLLAGAPRDLDPEVTQASDPVHEWSEVEAQAIKNPGARQTRAVKQLRGRARVALTGTPVENRLLDLWSIFDFLCPGLLGSQARFRGFVKALEAREQDRWAPLRNLVSPYILRRLKTDRSIIDDLPEKTEMKSFCGLAKPQAVLYALAGDLLEGGGEAALTEMGDEELLATVALDIDRAGA